MLATLFKKRQPSQDHQYISSPSQDQDSSASSPSADLGEPSVNTRTPERNSFDTSSSTTTPDGVVISSWLARHPNRSTFRPKASDPNSSRVNQFSPASPSTSSFSSSTNNNNKLQNSMSLTPIKKLFSRSRSASLGEADKDKEEVKEQWYTPDRSEIEAYGQFLSPSRGGGEKEERRGGTPDHSTSTLQVPSPHKSPYRSPTASQSSPALAQLPRSPSSEEAFFSFHQAEDLPSGTPNFGKRGILREAQQPRTGNSVRFISRDNICIISPNASLVFQSIDDSPIQQQQYPIFSSSSELSSPTSSISDEQIIDKSLHRQASTSPQTGPSREDRLRYGSTSPLSSPATSVINAFSVAPSTPVAPATPANSSTFLDRIRDVSASPGTPDSTHNRTLQHPQFSQSAAPSSSSLTRTRSQLSSVIQPESEEEQGVQEEQQQDGRDEVQTNELESMQLQTLDSEDESNLMDQSEKLADEEGEETQMQLDDLRMSGDDGEKETLFVQSLARPLSHSFPFVSLESSGRSYDALHDAPGDEAEGRMHDDEGLTEFHTIIVDSDAFPSELDVDDVRLPLFSNAHSASSNRSTTPPGTPSALPFSAAISSRPSNSPAASPPSHLTFAPASSPLTGNMTVYHTPSRTDRPTSSYFTSSHSGERTSWHTPRSAASVVSLLRHQLDTVDSSSSPSANEDDQGDPDTSLVPFNLQKSFAQSLVDKGFSPSPAHNQHQQRLSISSDLYLTVEPDSPSLQQRQLQPGQDAIVPANLSAPQILALNAEFYASQQHLLKVVQDKYDLQREISEELEGALERRDEEIRKLKELQQSKALEKQPPRDETGEVRDLEIRLENERRETANLRQQLETVRADQRAVISREGELQALVEGLEDEIRELEIRHLRQAEENGEGEDEMEGGGRKREELVQGLREKLAERDLAVWELRKEVVEWKEEEEERAQEAQERLKVDEERKDEQEKGRQQLLDTIRDLQAQLELAQTVAPLSSVLDDSLPAQASTLLSATASRPETTAEVEELRAQSAKDKAKLEESQGELEHQWKMADRAWEEIEGLKAELKQAKDDGSRKEEELNDQLALAQASLDASAASHSSQITSLTSQVETLTSETDRLTTALSSSEAEFLSLGEILAELEAERDGLLSSQNQLVAERDEALVSVEELTRGRDEATTERQEEKRKSSPEEEEWAAERDQVLEEREEFMRQRDEAWEELDTLQIKLDEAHAEVEAINVRTATMEASLLSSVQQVQDLTTRHAAEIAQLVQLRASHADALASKEHHLAQSRKYRDLLSTSDASLSSASLELATLKQRLDALEESSATKARESREKLELAEEEASKKIRDLTRTISSQTETISGLEADKREQRKVFEDAIRDRASAEMSAQMSSTRVEADSGELERLSKEVARLKSQEAQRELRIVHLTRSRAEVRECLEGLEIALDSKQQELELVKRKFGVRGVAGSQTPAAKPTASSTTSAPASSTRRESLATTLSKAATAGPDTPIAPTPAPRSRSRQSLATSTVQDTPTSNAFSRGMRPRTSLAMGTPGLHRNPNASRPRTSLGIAALSSSASASMAPPPMPTPAATVPCSETTPVAAATQAASSNRPRPSTTVSQPTPTQQPSSSSNLPRSTSQRSALSATTASTRSRSSASNHSTHASDRETSESETESIASSQASSSSALSRRSSASQSSLPSISLLSSSALDASLNRSTNSNASTSTTTSRIPLSTSSTSNHTSSHSRRPSMAPAVDATPRKSGSGSIGAIGRRLSGMNVPSTPAANARLARRGSVRPSEKAVAGGGEKIPQQGVLQEEEKENDGRSAREMESA